MVSRGGGREGRGGGREGRGGGREGREGGGAAQTLQWGLNAPFVVAACTAALDCANWFWLHCRVLLGYRALSKSQDMYFLQPL